MTHAEISRSKKGVNTRVDVELEATNVFIAWIGKEGKEATRQKVLTALEISSNTLAKENLIKLWRTGNLISLLYTILSQLIKKNSGC